jgi:hypothetical protein
MLICLFYFYVLGAGKLCYVNMATALIGKVEQIVDWELAHEVYLYHGFMCFGLVIVTIGDVCVLLQSANSGSDVKVSCEGKSNCEVLLTNILSEIEMLLHPAKPQESST